MFNHITKDNVQVWNAMNGFYPDVVLVEVPYYSLMQFNSINEAITYLLFNGFKDSAREINTKYKEYKKLKEST